MILFYFVFGDMDRIIVPNYGARLGNFGALYLNENESLVATSEGTDSINSKTGTDGRVYVVRIKWEN